MKLKTVLFGILGFLVLYGFTAKVSESNFSCGYCHDQEHAACEVAHFKNHIGSTRKYALAILDHLDERKVTVRIGNLRKLSPHRERYLI